MAGNHNTQAVSVLKASSWKPRKPSARVRWLSHPNGGSADPEAPDGISAASRQQSLSSNAPPIRTGVRIRRASESEHLLVISKSHTDSKEEAPSCSLGHFDDNQVFSTLFRYSTCYDVLPDSGKLVMVDSRLGVIRAIRVLLENGVQAAPIWHAPSHSVVGLFSQELALHLLASLHSSTVLSDALEESGEGDVEMQANTPEGQSYHLSDGLKVWGTRRLFEVLRVFHSEHNHGRFLPDPFDVEMIVTPRTRLRKALSRLLHHSKRPSLQTSPQHSLDGNNQPTHQLDHTPELMDCFSMDEVGPPQTHQRGHFDRQSSDVSTTSHTNRPCLPSHLMVMDHSSGNVLGILGLDRLLAYLRLRLDELPYAAPLLTPVYMIPGLRWSERSFSLKHHRMRHNMSEPTDGAAQLPSPILYPNSSCGEALRALSIWLPQVPALPVLSPNEGATTNSNALLGFISPGDLLYHVLGRAPDVAITQPVSKILDSKLAHCRFHQDCVCHTEEMIADALDRMFRLRAPCLVLFDSLLHGAVSGTPVGVLTARDLLRLLVAGKSHRSSTGAQYLSSHTDHDSAAWVAESQGSDEVMSVSFEKRKSTPTHNADSLLGASCEDDNASISSASSGSTCSPHSDDEHVDFVPRHLRHSAAMGRCNCACHHTGSGQLHTPPPHIKTAESPCERTTELRNITTRFAVPSDSNPEHHPTQAPTPTGTTFSANSPSFTSYKLQSTPKPTIYTKSPASASSYYSDKRHPKRINEEDSLFPMD